MTQTTKVILFVSAVAVIGWLLWGSKGFYALLPFPTETSKGVIG